MITLDQFLARVIDDGIQAAKDDYKSGMKLNGSIAGFEACRHKTVQELKELLEASHTATEDARHQDLKDRYWWYRCYELEVEWVANCVSALLYNEGQPTIITPTARGWMKAAEIVGIKNV